MPSIKTEVTEIGTALGMLAEFDGVDAALGARPPVLVNVLPSVWDRLDAARGNGHLDAEFTSSFENGRAFLTSSDGLRSRPPTRIEWKGPQNPPGFDFLPADLRVDHVYLVSCKYLSKVLANASPGNLFDRLLADRTKSGGGDWYSEVAPTEFDDFYSALRSHPDAPVLPATRADLSDADILAIRTVFGGSWPTDLSTPWANFSLAVATPSAERWSSRLTTATRREEMLWRLLRLSPAPYFVLGSSTAGPLRLRIGTPWDWRQRFTMEEFSVTPKPSGQPIVAWRGVMRDKVTTDVRVVEGHVQVRWSHGRFSSVEAKVYLDTAHEDVPGYFTLP